MFLFFAPGCTTLFPAASRRFLMLRAITTQVTEKNSGFIGLPRVSFPSPELPSCSRPVKLFGDLVREQTSDASNGLHAVAVFHYPDPTAVLNGDPDQFFFQIEFAEHSPSTEGTPGRHLKRNQDSL